MDIQLALTYDDVLLEPQYSRLLSRGQARTDSQLTKKIRLHVPIVSSNMDTVTENQMAIAMAQAGGVGIIHRFLPIDRQAHEIELVKRKQSIIIDDPYCINIAATLGDAWNLIEKTGVHSLLICDDQKKLKGIITSRDMMFAHDRMQKVSELMTPREKLVTAAANVSIDEAKNILKENRIEKLPLVDGDNSICGLITASDIISKANHILSTKDSKGRLIVGAAVGTKNDMIERTTALVSAGADFIVIDIAHGHSDNELNAIKKIKAQFPDLEIMGGNIATAQAAEDLIKAGVDAVKIGIGPGAACITRLVAGVGVPQLTAVMNATKVTRQHGVPACADGGIRHPGDIVKALAAGAQTVMLGSTLAGAQETPGPVISYRDQQFKIYRGMASKTANLSRPQKDKGETYDDVTAEGIEARVPFKGPVQKILNEFVGGLKSGMSYNNAETIEELQQNAKFVQITSAGQSESRSHSNEML